MNTWILILWFAAGTNYAYIATPIDGFLTLEACTKAGEKFVSTKKYSPTYICVSKQ